MSGQRVTCEPITKRPSEVLYIQLDMTLYGLSTPELLTGDPVIVEIDTDDFTLGNEQVNTATFLNRRGKIVAVGKGIQFTIAGGNSGGGLDSQGNYEISASCGSNGTPAQYLSVVIPIIVSDDD